MKYEYLQPIVSDNGKYRNSTILDNIEPVLKTTPVKSSFEKNIPESKYYWKVTGFSACSKSCGGGLQVPNIKCVRDNSNRYFPQRRCSNLKKPMLNDNLLRCNTQPCPAYWRSEEWSKCNCSKSVGNSEREVRCVQELASGIVIQVNKSSCFDEAPETHQSCGCRLNVLNAKRKEKKSQTPLRNSTIDKSCYWLHSRWNGRCSSNCGIGFEYRSIFCDKSEVPNGVCDTSNTPEVSKMCNIGKLCDQADWFTGPWSECSGSCFNLTKSRHVMCIQNNLITDIEDCKLSKKPRSLLRCSLKDVEYCKPNWHYSDWSEVSQYVT